MLENKRSIANIVNAAKSLQKAVKANNVEVSEVHLLDAMRYVVRGLDAIMPPGVETEEVK